MTRPETGTAGEARPDALPEGSRTRERSGPSPHRRSLDEAPATVEYRAVHKVFERPVLDGVSLTVREGEMFGIFGPSGTGKSVLLKTTIGLIVPDRGDVRVNGESVYFSGPGTLERIRRQVGYVFQHAALFDSSNVMENVEMGIPASQLEEIDRTTVARKVWEALELVNLNPSEVLSKLPAELSGGMKKRVGIARAIVGRPAILLWDEPTTGLDPINTAAVEKLILTLTHELEVTSVIVTHDIEGGLLMCDRVALLEGGILRYCGPAAEFSDSDDPIVQAFIDRTAAERALESYEVS